MDGFILVDKPKGMTSLSVCNKIKYQLGLDKCGHNGTLDPNATGVLVVATNRATKLLKLINEHDKEYIATIIFGYDSDTLDLDGKIINDIDMSFDMDKLLKAVKQLALKNTQIPPMTSAIKINGKKLYEYQRKGIEITREERPIKIYESQVLGEIRMIDNHLEVDIRLKVSKGFYVRSYAHDLGVLLGGCAVLKDLRRTMAGDFKLDNAIPLEELSVSSIKTIEEVFNLPRVEVNDYIASLVHNGIVLDERQTTINGVFYVTNNCDIIAIYEEVQKNKYKPILIFK